MELLDRLEPGSALGATLGPVKAVIYRRDRTADARLIASGIREGLHPPEGQGCRCSTPSCHTPRPTKGGGHCGSRCTGTSLGGDGVMPSASTVMHQLAAGLIPQPPGRSGRRLRCRTIGMSGKGVGRRAAATGGESLRVETRAATPRDLAGQGRPAAESDPSSRSTDPYEHNRGASANAVRRHQSRRFAQRST